MEVYKHDLTSSSQGSNYSSSFQVRLNNLNKVKELIK